MTDSEIKTYYKWLHPKQDRIGIIADLNGCKKEAIRRILNVEEKKKVRKTKWDLELARELWDQGKSDSEIATALGNGCKSGNVAC